MAGTQENLEYLVRVNDRDLKELKKNVDATNRSLDKDLGAASTSASSHLGKIGKAAKIAAVSGLAVLALGAREAWSDMKEGLQVTAQTQAVIKSTGGSARVTAKDVDTLASSISAYSGVDDEAVASGENMLLTFTNVRNGVGKNNQVFTDATKTLTDMSVAMGTDMPKQAIQLGKALNDPIKGISALSKVGVTFTDQQKKQIKSLVEHGNTVAAQKIILAELNKEFGGSAKAAGDTLPGQINKARNAFDNMASGLLTSLLPAMTSFIGFLSKGVQFLAEHEHATKIAVVALAGLSAAVFVVSAALKVYRAGAAVVTAVQWALNTAVAGFPVLLIIAALVALGAALIVAWRKSETFRDIVKGAWEVVKTAALGLVNFITVRVPAAFAAVIGWVRQNWPIIATLVSGPFAPLVALATNAFGIRSAIVGAFGAIKTRASEIIGDVVGFFRGMPARIGDAVQETAGEGWRRVKAALADIFGPVWKFVKRLFGISSPSTVFHELGERVVEGFVNGIRSRAGDVKDAIFGTFSGKVFGSAKAMWDSLTGFFGNGAGPPPPDVQALADFIGASVRAPTGTGGIAGGAASTGGLVNQVVQAIAWARGHGWHGGIISGFRTYAEQASLYARYVNSGYDNRFIAARPGTSSHEFGQAIDVTDWQAFARAMQSAPPGARLYNRLGGKDNPHWSVSGYDQGGWLPPGVSIAINKTGRPERVLAPHQDHGGPLVALYGTTVREEADIERIGSAVNRAWGVRR